MAVRAAVEQTAGSVTKRYDEPIEVTSDSTAGRAPLSFAWRGRRYEVDQSLMAWREGGQWWDGARARDRDYFRLLARPAGTLASGDLDKDGFMPPIGAVYDVYCERRTGGWRLARIWD